MSDSRRRELERKAAESGIAEDAGNALAEYVRSGLVTYEKAMLAAIAGSRLAEEVLDDELPSFDTIREWAEFLANQPDASIRLREAYAVISAIEKSEKRRVNDREESRTLFSESMQLAKTAINSPDKVHIQAFLDHAEASIPEVAEGTISGAPTTGGLPVVMVLLRSLIRYEYDNNSEDIEPNQILLYLIDLAMNEDFGAGLSEKEVKHAIRDEIVPYLLTPVEQ